MKSGARAPAVSGVDGSGLWASSLSDTLVAPCVEPVMQRPPFAVGAEGSAATSARPHLALDVLVGDRSGRACHAPPSFRLRLVLRLPSQHRATGAGEAPLRLWVVGPGHGGTRPSN